MPQFKNSNLYADIKKYTGNKNGFSKVMCFLYYNGIYASFIYRFLNYLACKNNIITKVIYNFLFITIYVPFKNITGVEIHPLASIGGGLFIPHCTGIVISKEAVIGKNFTIHQFSTVGINYINKQAPIIGNNVFVSCNSSLIGDIKVGSNVKILSNSSVVSHIPDNTIVGGVPARVLKNGKEII